MQVLGREEELGKQGVRKERQGLVRKGGEGRGPGGESSVTKRWSEAAAGEAGRPEGGTGTGSKRGGGEGARGGEFSHEKVAGS